jgi:replicative DNA helicase
MIKGDNRNYLREEFLNELFKLCLRSKDMMEICCKHLDYSYLPIEAYKNVWKAIKTHYVNCSTIPSIGSISQMFSTSSDQDMAVQQILMDIKESNLSNKSDILKSLEEYVKDAMAVKLYNDFTEKYSSGDRNGARDLLRGASESIHKFSVTSGVNHYSKVFGGFEGRHDTRKFIHESGGSLYDPIYFGIDELDEITGGVDVTEIACMIMRSGVGKTKFLRHVGVHNVRMGRNVLHIQGEGSKEACEAGYDATWTACTFSNIRKGSIDPARYKELSKIAAVMRNKGCDIYIHSFEQFNTASMLDIRDVFLDVEKNHSHIDLILGDYLELFDPGDGRKYGVDHERHRRLATANRMKNLCLEGHTRFVTCSQANDIPFKLLDDPDFVMTRHNVSECKGLVNPFTIYLTGNQTSDEYSSDIMRIYVDKNRYAKGSQVIQIVQNYDRDRFYDRNETLKRLFNKENVEKDE